MLLHFALWSVGVFTQDSTTGVNQCKILLSGPKKAFRKIARLHKPSRSMRDLSHAVRSITFQASAQVNALIDIV